MTIPLHFASLYDDNEDFVWSDCPLDLGTDSLVGNIVFCMRCVVSCGSTSFPWLVFLLWSSGVRVHDSQAYRKMDVIRERISCILELIEMLLSFKTGFNLVYPAIACAVMESISGFKPSSDAEEPRYLELVTVSSFCPFTLISLLMPLVLLSSTWSSRY